VSRALAIVPAVLFPLVLSAQLSTHLSAESNQAFDDYVKSAETKMDWKPHLQVGGSGITVAALPKSPLEVKDALIHDWQAAALAPDTTVDKALAVLQSYSDYKRIYTPEVTDSRVLAHEGARWRVYLRLFKKKVLSADLSSEYDIDYKPLGPARWGMLSRSTRRAELQDGRELPAGEGHGFLWRLNAYWVLEQRDRNVYLECRAISMSRDIPTGLGWMIKPMVTILPRESLRNTLDATIRALR